MLDAERLFDALDDGLILALAQPSLLYLVSILRAAQALSIPSAIAYATILLSQLWPLDLEATSSTTVSLSELIAIADVTFKHDLHLFKKRVSYELIRDTEFWDKVEMELESLPIADSDLARLLEVRAALRIEWNNAMSAPPNPADFPCPLVAERQGGRADEQFLETLSQCARARWKNAMQWVELVFQSDVLEMGEVDLVGAA